MTFSRFAQPPLTVLNISGRNQTWGAWGTQTRSSFGMARAIISRAASGGVVLGSVVMATVLPLGPQVMEYPPSMGRTTPVMNAAAGEPRNMTAPATSAGLPQRPSGVLATIAAERAGSSVRGRVSAVSIQPGAIALTRIPSDAQAIASDFVNWATPPFARAVRGSEAAAEKAEHRSEVDDTATAPRQQGTTGPAHAHRPHQVHVHDPMEALWLELEAASEDHAGGVDQHVQPIERRHEPADGVLVGDVEAMGREAACRVATGRDLSLGQARHHDLRTLGREGIRNRSTDSARSARDQDRSTGINPNHPHPAPPSTIRKVGLMIVETSGRCYRPLLCFRDWSL